MGSPIRVLLIEDSEDDAILLVRGLKRQGFDTTLKRVDTPEAMSNALDTQKWDIVLSDYSMPRFNTIEALKMLKDKDIDLPFIIVSGAITPEDEEKARLEGARDYVMKGHLEDLITIIARELNINPSS